MLGQELEKYILNGKLSINTLTKYGFVNGGGQLSIEYAKGNYIYFSLNSYKFLGVHNWYRDPKIDYHLLLKDKTDYLKKHRVIVKRK